MFSRSGTFKETQRERKKEIRIFLLCMWIRNTKDAFFFSNEKKDRYGRGSSFFEPPICKSISFLFFPPPRICFGFWFSLFFFFAFSFSIFIITQSVKWSHNFQNLPSNHCVRSQNYVEKDEQRNVLNIDRIFQLDLKTLFNTLKEDMEQLDRLTIGLIP